MNKRTVLRLRRPLFVAPVPLSILDAAFISILFLVSAASFLQVPLDALTPFPKVQAAEPPARIVVWVHEAGTLDVNGTTVRIEDLTLRLQSLVALRPGMPVQVVAPTPADDRLIARALEAARAAGAPSVSVTRLAS